MNFLIGRQEKQTWGPIRQILQLNKMRVWFCHRYLLPIHQTWGKNEKGREAWNFASGSDSDSGLQVASGSVFF